VDTVTDPEGHVLDYDWCGCGSPVKLTQVLSGSSRETEWDYEIQGRLIKRTPDDHTSGTAKKWTYEYEDTTSRLKEVTDGEGNVTEYTYTIDDRPDTIVWNDGG